MDIQVPWKRAWITGAGRGIGYSLAAALAKAGVDVLASARSKDQLEQLSRACSAYPGEIIPTPLDITDQDQVHALFSLWDKEAMLPDLVVLNAGTHDPFPASEFSAQRVEALLSVNVLGTVKCIEPVLKRFMAENTGQLAVMASVAGYRGLPTAAAYGASKAALINMTEALRLDLKGTGVKIQLINPGFVRTPLTDKNDFKMPALLEPEEAAERIIKGLMKDSFEITFPKRFVYLLKLLRILPYSMYLKLISSTVETDRSNR